MRLEMNRLTATPLGRLFYRPIQALIHLARRLRHPDLPLEWTVTRASCRQRNFSIVHRRWSYDKLAIDQCFCECQYDIPTGAHGVLTERIYREIIASGKKPLIVDCGANIGASVLWFTARYPEAHIVAVEPSPANFALLFKNCSGFDVDLREAGIGSIDGKAWMNNPDGTLGCRTNNSRDGIGINIISLKTILASKPSSEYVPFLLKVDIEGAEKSLFAGSASDLNQFPLILMEPHDWLFPGELTSVEFFRFHAQAGREFAMHNENIASILWDPRLLDLAKK
ncbi:MAG: FkbM family methyltransferase [Terracidiphilus sp.]|jgi:FkbM family methyltransferase